MPHPTLNCLLWDQEDQDLQLKPTLEDCLYLNKSWWRNVLAQLKTTKMLSSPNKKLFSLLQRLLHQQPTKPQTKLSLLLWLCTLTCSKNGPESLTKPEPLLNQMMLGNLQIGTLLLLKRMDFSKSKALSSLNLLEIESNLISPALDELNNHLKEVSSPQTSCTLMKSSLHYKSPAFSGLSFVNSSSHHQIIPLKTYILYNTFFHQWSV